jgi:hypothetical protein
VSGPSVLSSARLTAGGGGASDAFSAGPKRGLP